MRHKDISSLVSTTVASFHNDSHLRMLHMQVPGPPLVLSQPPLTTAIHLSMQVCSIPRRLTRNFWSVYLHPKLEATVSISSLTSHAGPQGRPLPFAYPASQFLLYDAISFVDLVPGPPSVIFAIASLSRRQEIYLTYILSCSTSLWSLLGRRAADYLPLLLYRRTAQGS